MQHDQGAKMALGDLSLLGAHGGVGKEGVGHNLGSYFLASASARTAFNSGGVWSCGVAGS